MHLTVVICTWNRANALDATLASITRLLIPHGCAWEVLVVDNNSTDETPKVAKEYAAALPVRYVFEPQQGLSHARNRAAREALGDLIVFTDDDVLADPHWLREYAAAFDAFPDAAFFGGTIDVAFAGKPPRWLRENFQIFESAYAVRIGDRGTSPISDREYLPYGANMAFRRSVLADEAFALHLGRMGADLLSGEEVDLMARLLARGARGVWVGSARVEHVIPTDRLTKAYIHNYYFWQGRAHVRLKKVYADIDAGAERRLKKKLGRAQRRLRFAFRKDAAWAASFKWCAVQEGRLAELADQGRRAAA